MKNYDRMHTISYATCTPLKVTVLCGSQKMSVFFSPLEWKVWLLDLSWFVWHEALSYVASVSVTLIPSINWFFYWYSTRFTLIYAMFTQQNTHAKIHWRICSWHNTGKIYLNVHILFIQIWWQFYSTCCFILINTWMFAMHSFGSDSSTTIKKLNIRNKLRRNTKCLLSFIAKQKLHNMPCACRMPTGVVLAFM